MFKRLILNFMLVALALLGIQLGAYATAANPSLPEQAESVQKSVPEVREKLNKAIDDVSKSQNDVKTEIDKLETQNAAIQKHISQLNQEISIHQLWLQKQLDQETATEGGPGLKNAKLDIRLAIGLGLFALLLLVWVFTHKSHPFKEEEKNNTKEADETEEDILHSFEDELEEDEKVEEKDEDEDEIDWRREPKLAFDLHKRLEKHDADDDDDEEDDSSYLFNPFEKEIEKPSSSKLSPFEEFDKDEQELKDEYDFMGSDEAIPIKLDLARVYIDMDDHDSAQRVLESVLEKGTTAQKEEARTLMKQLKV